MDSEPRRDRSDSSIWLICVLTAALIITGICWRIQVSQIRQSKIPSDRNYQESNSTLQSKLSALSSNLSVLKRTLSDLLQQFTEIETKYRSFNETKEQICEFLTNRTEQTCSKDWIKNKDRCYYGSTFETSFYRAMQECSNNDSRLLEINSSDEASFVSHKLLYQTRAYWIGKCEDGNVGLALLYNVSPGTSDCRDCEPYAGNNPCDSDRRFICEKEVASNVLCRINGGDIECGEVRKRFVCEKSAPLCPDSSEKIQDLCQQPMGPT
ncbi:oxidized low-density lipoprotein receptor 1-like [Hemitrygon akajei]|uniref:oxidized low-density lipoprotein receptor 1-like n=1 Tax=Hemitrygon akajei TaxID=2704970 RepID=UPI003BF9A61F